MEKRCDGCGEKHGRYFAAGAVSLCSKCCASLWRSAGLVPTDAEREVLRLAREWSASLRRGDETCALVDSPLVAAVMRLEG